MDQEQAQSPAFNIELPEEIANGTYANLAIVMHSQSEFVIDFVRLLPNAPSAKVNSRIVMTPDNAKRLVRILQQNIMTYEQQIAPINLPEDAHLPEGGGFGHGQA